MTLDVLSASIAHEMRQPLASIVTNVDAASRWMGRPTPDLDEVKATLEQIRNSASRPHWQHPGNGQEGWTEQGRTEPQ